MTSKPSSSSPEFPPSGRQEISASQPASIVSSPSSSPELPTGRCMFIAATAEKRCSCHAFQRCPVLPGAYCDSCGHQASYHSSHHHQNNMPPPPLPSTEPTCTSPSYATLLQRLHHVETSHALDRKQWEKELRRERHSRQEDIRALRETMFSFFRVVERDIPRQFADFEDKIENLVDHHQRLREKVISVDDFSMAVEDRVIDLEQQKQQHQQTEQPRRSKRGERQARVDSNVVQPETRAHENDWHMSVKEETGESSIPEISQQEFPQVPQAKEESNSSSKESMSVKRKRSLRIPLPNPPPLFLSE